MLLALDLEGTLISNAMSVFPRPGLHEFLTFCHDHASRVVVFTALSTQRARPIVELLAKEGSAPAWFHDVEIVDWSGPYKDLHFAGVEDPSQALLVDDLEAYVHPEQRARWVPIENFAAPYPDEDRELEVTRARLLERLKEAR